MLTNLIKTYKNPVLDKVTNKLVADKGLYITNLTDKINALYINGSSSGTANDYVSTNLTTFSLDGGKLGYNSYELLERFYNASFPLWYQTKIFCILMQIQLVRLILLV